MSFNVNDPNLWLVHGQDPALAAQDRASPNLPPPRPPRALVVWAAALCVAVMGVALVDEANPVAPRREPPPARAAIAPQPPAAPVVLRDMRVWAQRSAPATSTTARKTRRAWKWISARRYPPRNHPLPAVGPTLTNDCPPSECRDP
jgi:hypothetical protein